MSNPDGSQLQPIKRTLAGQGLTQITLSPPILTVGLFFTDHHRQQGIVPQLIMIVEILVAQGQPINPLGDEFFDRMLDQIGITMIGETPGKLPDDARDPFGLL